jgi:hypothetical protein
MLSLSHYLVSGATAPETKPLPLSFATFRAPESESVICHLDVIRIRQAGTGGLRQPAKKFLYFLLTPAAPYTLSTQLYDISCT